MFGHVILHKMGKYCMYMVIRNEVKVMLFRLSAPRIFDQDCSLNVNLVRMPVEGLTGVGSTSKNSNSVNLISEN